MSPHISLILLAGGKGTRFGGVQPKQFVDLHGKPLILHSFNLFKEIDWIDEIVVVCSDEYRPLFQDVKFADPGERRQDSMFNGFLQSSGNWIIIHDGARPFLLKEEMEKLKNEAFLSGAATLATPVKATIKEARSDRLVTKTLERKSLWEIQTPQMIKRAWLQEGFDHILKQGIEVTDDVSIVEALGYPVKLVEGSPSNLKVTTPIDLAVMKELLCPATA